MRRLLSLTMACAFLAACAPSVAPPPRDAHAPPPQAPEQTPPAQTLPPLAPDADGGYYLNDGPPTEAERARAGSAPDAAPRWEPIAKANSRPYVALGKQYRPHKHLSPYRKRGVASWYGRRYHGRPTASGEIYDMFKMTAAHPLLPIPSYARVRRISTGAEVVVRINDRGPFLGGRLIDLSYAAAERLGYVEAGTAEVEVELIIPPQAPAGAVAAEEAEESPPPPLAPEIYIQLAAFESAAPAEEFMAALRGKAPSRLSARATVYAADGLYRVQVGPYETRAAAVADDGVLCGDYDMCGFLTQRPQR